MEFEKVSILLEKAIKKAGSSTYKLEEQTGYSRRYIRAILDESNKEKGSKEAIEKILDALSISKKERIEIWGSWLSQKGFNEVAEFIYKKN